MVRIDHCCAGSCIFSLNNTRIPLQYQLQHQYRKKQCFDPNFTHSPSGATVPGAALDIALPVLLNFHLFIAAFSHPRYAGSNTPKVFPCKIPTLVSFICFHKQNDRKLFTNISPLFHCLFYFFFALCYSILSNISYSTYCTSYFPQNETKTILGIHPLYHVLTDIQCIIP
jgi:hypothetical protein